MNNLKEKVNLINTKNIELLKKYVKENNNVENLSEFMEILLNICPNVNNNKCSDKNRVILEVGKNINTRFYTLLTSVCYSPIALPFDTNTEEGNFNPAIRIKEYDKDINVITIFLKNITDIKIEDYSIPAHGTERYKISFKYRTCFDNNGKNCNSMDYSLDLRITNSEIC